MIVITSVRQWVWPSGGMAFGEVGGSWGITVGGYSLLGLQE